MLVNKTNRLQSDFTPLDLILTDSKYKDEIYLCKEVFEAFKRMRDDAFLEEGYKIDIMSGYRDYKYQEKLYNNLIYEKGLNYALTRIAPAGGSEHQTGLALDFCVYFDNRCYIEDDILELMATKWVHDNCYKYGFILRYPFDKEEVTGYSYEPWHLRYVGNSLSKYLYDNNLTLDEYKSV